MEGRAYIGRFRQKVILQRSSRTLSGRGVPQHTWTTAATLLAEVVENGSAESVVNQNISMQRTITVRCYKVSDMDASWRLQWGGDLWNITSITPEQDRPFVELTCTRIMQ